MHNKKNITEFFFSYIVKNFKTALMVFLVPQIFLIVYTQTIEKENCLGSSRIVVSEAVSNVKIVDEILIENLNLDDFKDIELYGNNRVIFKGKTDAECIENHQLISTKIDEINLSIEKFYFEQLSEEERARFANPLLFNYIGSNKIEYAKLTSLDLVSLQAKEETKYRFYVLILSVISFILYFFYRNKKKLFS